ncbi:MAG TPA: 4-hydroxy-tetrahydrodipicolinate reductase [Methanocorpusculum sp.]|nr:4-hydroxy-tetrahydrodipicolinate reductase [Methanocorpusculum sp.]
MIKVMICGILGRMGAIIADIVTKNPDLDLVGGVDIRSGQLFGKPVLESSNIQTFIDTYKPDVMIDFTIASATLINAKVAAKNNVALIIGTTGFTPDQESELLNSIKNVPAIKTTNFSIGMNIFWDIIGKAAKKLKDYDIEIIEAHHRNKKDAPSGTAKTILKVIKDEIGDRDEVYARNGITERGNEIGVHVIRGGDIVGDHTVQFHKNYETIEFTHRAYDRSVFAHGAVCAAMWIYKKEPGMYTMKDVLGI